MSHARQPPYAAAAADAEGFGYGCVEEGELFQVGPGWEGGAEVGDRGAELGLQGAEQCGLAEEVVDAGR